MKRNVNDEYVVTDIAVVCDDEDVPDDFAGVLITKDTSELLYCFTNKMLKA